MTKDKIIKFLNNRCTDAELDEIIEWANTEAFSEESVAWGFSDWNEHGKDEHIIDHKRFTDIFDKIQERITVESAQENRKPRKQLFLSRLTRAAAVLLLPALAFLFYTLAEISAMKSGTGLFANLPADSLEVIAPIGSRTVLQLPDGSVAHLNYGSRLRYTQNFTGSTREVKLTGEGYFEVAHNPEKPFIVKTDGLNIRALGTAFNVQAYPDGDEVETTLVEGKVVLESTAPGRMEAIETMMPGQHVTYHAKTGAVASSEGNMGKYVAWKDGKLVFDETTIVEAADKLERMFNVVITVKDDIKGFTYTVTFEDEPLFQILDLMAIATPLQYKALPRKMLPDGSFSKQQIILERKH